MADYLQDLRRPLMRQLFVAEDLLDARVGYPGRVRDRALAVAVADRLPDGFAPVGVGCATARGCAADADEAVHLPVAAETVQVGLPFGCVAGDEGVADLLAVDADDPAVREDAGGVVGVPDGEHFDHLGLLARGHHAARIVASGLGVKW